MNSRNRSANLTFLGHLGRSVGRTVGRGLVILFGALHKGDLLVASFLLLVGSHRGCFGSGKTLENESKINCVPTAIQNCTEAAVLLFSPTGSEESGLRDREKMSQIEAVSTRPAVAYSFALPLACCGKERMKNALDWSKEEEKSCEQ